MADPNDAATCKIKLLSKFSYYLQKSLVLEAKQELARFFDQFILLKKGTLNKNIDPSNPQSLPQMCELYTVAQDCLLYFKCLKEVEQVNS